MAEEIISPPYPADTTTVPRLLQHLVALREWLIDMRFWANETASEAGYPGEVVPPIEHIPAIPDLARFGVVSVVDIMRSYMGMRSLREEWDSMVRLYEDAWNCKPAVIMRLRCVQQAVMILMHAFVDPETREARQEEAHRRVMKTMHKIMRRMGVP